MITVLLNVSKSGIRQDNFSREDDADKFNRHVTVLICTGDKLIYQLLRSELSAGSLMSYLGNRGSP
jgi:hypothetical protein